MSRSVHTQTCKCGAAVLVGLDRDWLALDTTLDAHPVDNVGEFLAIAQGRRTFDLRPFRSSDSSGRYMDERNAWRIRNPWRPPYPIHAEHRCGQPLPAAANPPAEPATGTSEELLDMEAPF